MPSRAWLVNSARHGTTTYRNHHLRLRAGHLLCMSSILVWRSSRIKMGSGMATRLPARACSTFCGVLLFSTCTADLTEDGEKDVTHNLEGPSCTDCLSTSKVVTLGESDDPGMLDFGTMFAARDGQGRYWISQSGRIVVFGADGVPIDVVGSEGQGPMQFLKPHAFHVDEEGVFVADNSNARLSVIDPSFQLVHEQRLPGYVSDLAFLDGPRRYVSVMTHRTADGLGQPMHLVVNGEVVKSFGKRGLGVVHALDAQVLVASSVAGGFFSVPAYDYRIDTWTDDADLRWSQVGPTLNRHEVKGGLIGPDNPPPARIVDIAANESVIFLLIWQPASDWEDHVVEVIRPDGVVAYEPVDDLLTGLYEARVDVIRIGSTDVVASQVIDGLFVRFLDRGRYLLRNDFTELGEPRMEVFSLSLEEA